MSVYVEKKKTVTKETLTSSVSAHFHILAFPGGSGERPLLRPGPIRSAHFETILPMTSCTPGLGAAGGGGVQPGKEGAEQSVAAEGEPDSPSSRRKPWWRRVAFVRMLWTKQRDFTDELTSTNVDPRRSSASGTTVLRRYFVIYFIFPPLV